MVTSYPEFAFACTSGCAFTSCDCPTGKFHPIEGSALDDVVADEVDDDEDEEEEEDEDNE